MGPFHEEGHRMDDSERSGRADRNWLSGPGAERQARQRWIAEEKARVVSVSFRPGERVGEVARRYRLGRACLRERTRRRKMKTVGGKPQLWAVDADIAMSQSLRRLLSGVIEGCAPRFSTRA